MSLITKYLNSTKKNKKVTLEQLRFILLFSLDNDSAIIVCDYLSWSFQMTLIIEADIQRDDQQCSCFDPSNLNSMFDCVHFMDRQNYVNSQTCVITRPLKLAENLFNLESKSEELYYLFFSSFPENYYSKILYLKYKEITIFMTEDENIYKNKKISTISVDYYPE